MVKPASMSVAAACSAYDTVDDPTLMVNVAALVV